MTVGCHVEQVAVVKAHGALSMRVHQHGEMIRRGHYLRVYVRVEGDTEPVSIRPHLVRVLPAGIHDATH